MIDPIADKLLMSAAFISLVELELAPAWIVFCIVAREFAVTGLRLVALQEGVAVAANRWGKAKTGSQVVAVSLLILGYRLHGWRDLGLLALWVALALTMISMVVYFYENWRVVSSPGTRE
jgi:CDP-diacylglycerol--glycerol-3-phosphate 3-phosphatidyltransferase